MPLIFIGGEIMAAISGQYKSTAVTYSNNDIVEILPTDSSGALRTSPYPSIDNYLGTITIPISDSVVAGTLASGMTGLMRYVTFTVPALEATGTATLTIVDAAGGTLFSQAENESTTTTIGSIVPIMTTMNFIVTANGTQSAIGTCKYRVYYEK